MLIHFYCNYYIYTYLLLYISFPPLFNSFLQADLDRFAARNSDAEIQRRRAVRKSLRAVIGATLYNPFERWETHKVEDGTETYKDSNGNSHTRTRYSSVQVSI